MIINRKYRNLTMIFLCTASVLCMGSCLHSEKKSEIVREYKTAAEASEACGLAQVDFVPEGYSVAAYRTVYNYVSETEYMNGEKTAVLRIVSTEYNTTNLSGFAETGLAEVYSARDGREFELGRTRENVYTAEWQQSYGGVQCNMSFVLMNGEIGEYKIMLESLLDYLGESQ